MTVFEIAEKLSNVSQGDAEYEAKLLLSHFGGFSFSQILSDNPDFNSEELHDAIKKRLEHTPIAYILGQTEFYREKYFVSEDCLIPRSDTEIIVDYAIRHLPKNAYFADLCTGCGCIAISILSNRSDCRAIACDVSDGALKIAEKNAHLNRVSDRIEFVSHDVLSSALNGKFDAVISNPPYIRSDVIPTLSEEVKKEPTSALDGGIDGMVFYKRILPLYTDELKENGFFLFETGYDQKEAITEIAKENSFHCECINDYGKNHRGAILKKLSSDK